MTLEREISLSQAQTPREIADLLTKGQKLTLLAMPDQRPKSFRTAHRHAKVGFVSLPFRLCHPCSLGPPMKERLTALGLAVKSVLIEGEMAT
jgi:hypothetical protein